MNAVVFAEFLARQLHITGFIFLVFLFHCGDLHNNESFVL